MTCIIVLKVTKFGEDQLNFFFEVFSKNPRSPSPNMVNLVIFVPRKHSKKPRFLHKNIASCQEVSGIKLLSGFSSTFSQNSPKFFVGISKIGKKLL